MDAEIDRQTLAAKVLKTLCVGYAVIFNTYFAFVCLAMGWESFHPRYRLPQTSAGLKSVAFALMFLVIALGVAFGHQWARWVSIALGSVGLGYSVFLFWDGYLRAKSEYSGEESSEVFAAIVLSITSLPAIVAMFAPVVQNYFRRSASSTAQAPPHR